ncbi:hypothetical protein NLI96_g6512 [Meripilus lineatus]|uniref:Uncharacterized protein n=1 Tax=Meripilus lineatus TaxID=2056292 RepID=A0AAD5YDT9_9APHY|nr:hypothetical protein NLI96_g6512 [Physisporinus lineatus]
MKDNSDGDAESSTAAPGPSTGDAAPTASTSQGDHEHEQIRPDEDEGPSQEEVRNSVNAALGPGVNVDDLLDHEMAEASEATSSSEEDNTDTDSEMDFVENTCNGIQDIIITGETLPRHGEAWHHYRFYGRVRHWDGLIALVRIPTALPELGVAIFRGYVTGNKNFVGSWRAFTSNVHTIPLEGPFVISKAASETFSN